MHTETIGLIGIGLLGTALAERLIDGGFAVLGFDANQSRREALGEIGGEAAESPTDVAASCRRILFSLPTTDIVETVIDELSDKLQRGQIIIDTTTGEPRRTAALGARLADRGVQYLDATVSGSSEQARRGDVIVMAGGDREAFKSCNDIFRTFARRSYHVGPSGCGARMKLVSNLVLGLNRAALAEGLAFARTLDLDLSTALAILIDSAAYSRIMDTKGEKMIRADFSPQARLSQHLKDVRLILEAATDAGLDLPLTETHRRLLEAAEAAGFGDADNSAITQAYSEDK